MTKKYPVLILIALLAVSCHKKSLDASKKVLNYGMEAEIASFDPIMPTDQYSHEAVSEVYEGLLEYEYLKRPYTLRPCLAEAMPEISKDGKTYTFKLRKGVLFHDDPAFQGKKRELKASDVIYSYKRLADPNTKSPNWWILEDKIEGLNEFRQKLMDVKTAVDYDQYPVSGLSAPDDYTVVVKLTKPSPIILYFLAMYNLDIVAKEVVETYKQDFASHPIGTGPFVLKDWKRNQKMTLVKNPNYWGSTYPTEGEPQDAAKGLLTAAGKKLPFVDELVLWVYVERQTMWLNFMKGNIDFAQIPKDAFDTVFDAAGNMKEEMKKMDLSVDRQIGTDLVFEVFNMKDPIIGKNPHLRKALSLSQNREEKIKIFYNNRAVEAQGPIAPGFFGYDPNLKNPYSYDLEKAKAEFAKAKELHKKLFGDKPLKLTFETSNSPASRQLGEAIIADFQKIGLDVDMQTYTFSVLSDRMNHAQGQIYAYGWNADYPDPDTFLQLLYGKNVSPGPNNANFQNAEYDRLYEQMKNMPNGPERQNVISQMVRIIHEEVPWILFNHRISVWLAHPWTKNFKRQIVFPGYFKNLDIDTAEKIKRLPTLH